MKREALLLEIGCEEIPARMIRAAAEELATRLVAILDRAELPHGGSTCWAGPRRLAVRIETVEARQQDRDEVVLGPPAAMAFDGEGRPTRAAAGFAKKQGVGVERLERRSTDRGEYLAIARRTEGLDVAAVLREQLPGAVAGMSFPKTMRWAEGDRRWVRPVHWVLALHGDRVLELELFGVASGGESAGHRFLAPTQAVPIGNADRYLEALEGGFVIAQPAERRRRLAEGLARAAKEADAQVVEDQALLDEVADLVEWPGTVAGEFDAAFLDLPREVLVTTLRHHQKCFSLQDADGSLLARFVAVANTDRDPIGHIRRGNEWVIGGRLEDARFFWREDLARPLTARSAELAGIVFHAAIGSFAEKAQRTAEIATSLAGHLDLDPEIVEHCREAALLAKLDLVTGTVGEFPELQGKAGGLLLRAEGRPEPVAIAVYEHYQPAGPDDEVPQSPSGGIVSIADKLDTTASMIAAGQAPTGSRDPFAIRRASTGIFRTILAKQWPVSLGDLVHWARGDGALGEFLLERFRRFLKDSGYTPNEIQAVFRPAEGSAATLDGALDDTVRRLDAIRTVRARDDFAQLADLTKRVDNILTKGEADFVKAEAKVAADTSYEERAEAARQLAALVERHSAAMLDLETAGRYREAIDLLAEFVSPVERFFDEVLVLDPSEPVAMLHRKQLLVNLRSVLTRCFDVRELAGQADRRSS